ncbi:hypothetical protein SLS56_004201 [Neofusicoccum ribis]|uniref:Uncharacterized protein n=1 Tax=Neofusicoccum ribis TaxID=45134 RepID=A0ABR3SWX3_9PEZI
MSVSLAQRHADCWQAFTDSCDSASESTAHHENLQEEFDKYRLWAGNVGATHSGKTYQLSLDYRLREAPFYREQVSKLLEILTRQVGKTAEILRGARVPFEEASSDSESGDDSRTSDMEEDSPWEISSDSEAETSEKPTQQKSTMAPMPRDSSSKDPLEEIPPGQTGTAKSPPITELGQLLESIRVTVTCLYKLPLRKPASIDRLGDETTEDVICFQPFDLLYIQDKFPRLDPEVAARFAKTITRRRQLLLYRKRHRDKLRTEATAPAARATDPEKHSNDPALQNKLHAHIFREQENRPAVNAPSLRESNPNTVKTKASTFKMDGIPQIGADELLAPSIAQSDSKTSIVASEATRDIHVEVPPRPKTREGFNMARFECKYCCLTAHVRSDKSWKYECFCNTAGHASHSSASDFERHMKEMHQKEFDATMPLDMFRQPQPQSGICNLCSGQTDNLKRHVSRHLQQVALFALPRADYAADDEDLQEGDSDAAQYRAKSSQLLDVKETSSQSSEESSSSSQSRHDADHNDAEDVNAPSSLGEGQQQVTIPDADEPNWDLLINKFSMAREGNAEIAPFLPQRNKLTLRSLPLRLMVFDIQTEQDDVLRELTTQELFSRHHQDLTYPVLCGLGDSKVSEYVGESATFHRAFISTLETYFLQSSKPWSLLELRDALNQRREDMGAYGYVAELVYPKGIVDPSKMVFLYPVAKKRFSFRGVCLAVWAAVALRRDAAKTREKSVSPYRRVGVMLFLVEREEDEDDRAFEVAMLKHIIQRKHHYEIHEPKLRTWLPLFPQLVKFLDNFFKRFDDPGDLIIICFEGLLGTNLSTNTALYKSFLNVVQDYLQEPKSDSFILMHASEHCKRELELQIRSQSPHKRLLPNSEILICTYPQHSVANMIRRCLEQARIKTAQEFRCELQKGLGGVDGLYLSRFPSVGKLSSNIPLLPLPSERRKTLYQMPSVEDDADDDRSEDERLRIDMQPIIQSDSEYENSE